VQLPRPRFTVRRLMILVAVVALILGGVIISERRRSMFTVEYRRHALTGYETALKLMIVVSGLTTSGQPLPPLPEVARRAGLDAVMNDAGWKTQKSIPPMNIDQAETIRTGRLGHLLRVVEYHRQLRRKYQQAAKYPWLPVATDPPEPK
jgi:hypothetical protein